MRTTVLVALSLFVCASAAAQKEIHVEATGQQISASLLAADPVGDDFPELRAEPGKCDSAMAVATAPAGCEIDFSRQESTTWTDPRWGQGAPGYGIRVHELNAAGGAGTHLLDASTKSLRSFVMVCGDAKNGAIYKARHELYVRCPKPVSWTGKFGPYAAPSSTQWTHVADLPPLPGVLNPQFTIVPPAGIQAGLFAGHPDQTGNKGLQLWAKMSSDNDLTVTALEVTQGIQNMSNEMPLVSRRRTVVRAYVRASNANVNGVQAQLTAHRLNQQLGSIPAENAAAIRTGGGDRATLDDSFWFILPDTWREKGEIAFTATVDPGNLFVETDETNNSRGVLVTFDSGREMTVNTVPLHLHENGHKSGPVQVYTDDQNTFSPILNNLLRYLPAWDVLRMDCGTDVQFPALHDLGVEWNMSKVPEQARVLARVALVRALSFCGSATTHWIGLVHPKVDTNGVLGMAEPFGRSSWVKMNNNGPAEAPWRSQGGATLAHELGHNRGPGHVICAGNEPPPHAPQPYPHPHPDCRIGTGQDGFFGFDVYYDLWNRIVPAVITNDPNAGIGSRGLPLMGYADPSCADPFDYCLLLPTLDVPCNYFISFHKAGGPGTTTPGLLPTEPDRANQRYVLVGGVFDGIQGKVEDLDLLQLDRVSPNALAGALGWNDVSPDLVISQVDASKNVLAERRVTASAAEGDPRVVPFLETIPLAMGAKGVQIRSGNVVVAERMASANAPKVQFLAPRSGTLPANGAIRWAASDADGDALTYTVLYSADGGTTWRPLAVGLRTTTLRVPRAGRLPGSTSAIVRILASDGYHTAGADSPRLTVPTSPPVVRIQQPDGYAIPLGRTLILDGSATDIDEGVIADGARFRWFSSRDGVLGTGRELSTRTLSKGVHQIRLEVTDQDGRTGGAGIRVYVGVPAPVIRREVIAATN